MNPLAQTTLAMAIVVSVVVSSVAWSRYLDKLYRRHLHRKRMARAAGIFYGLSGVFGILGMQQEEKAARAAASVIGAQFAVASERTPPRTGEIGYINSRGEVESRPLHQALPSLIISPISLDQPRPHRLSAGDTEEDTTT